MRRPSDRGLHDRRTDETAANALHAAGSERAFGVLLGAVLAALGCWPLLNGEPPRWQVLGGAAAALAVAGFRPRWLRPLSRLWLRFGLLLHRVVSPVMLAAIYFLVFTPTGLVMRAFGRDPLRLKRDAAAESYWLERDPPGPDRESMTKQF